MRSGTKLVPRVTLVLPKAKLRPYGLLFLVFALLRQAPRLHLVFLLRAKTQHATFHSASL
jgi:hypothetical protein